MSIFLNTKDILIFPNPIACIPNHSVLQFLKERMFLFVLHNLYNIQYIILPYYNAYNHQKLQHILHFHQKPIFKSISDISGFTNPSLCTPYRKEAEYFLLITNSGLLLMNTLCSRLNKIHHKNPKFGSNHSLEYKIQLVRNKPFQHISNN